METCMEFQVSLAEKRTACHGLNPASAFRFWAMLNALVRFMRMCSEHCQGLEAMMLPIGRNKNLKLINPMNAIPRRLPSGSREFGTGAKNGTRHMRCTGGNPNVIPLFGNASW
eukprot:1436053-Amphidinium_carterae.1